MPTARFRRLEGHGSQQAFDCILRALAEPGTVRRLPAAARIDHLHPVTTLVLALADVEVDISVDGDDNSPLAHDLADRTGATVAPIADALLVVATRADPDLLARCARGSALEPERGARAAIACRGIGAGVRGATTLRIAGPGVPGTRTVTIGVARSVIEAVIDANRSFPAGIDVWFISVDGDVVALSRSTTVTIEED